MVNFREQPAFQKMGKFEELMAYLNTLPGEAIYDLFCNGAGADSLKYVARAWRDLGLNLKSIHDVHVAVVEELAEQWLGSSARNAMTQFKAYEEQLQRVYRAVFLTGWFFHEAGKHWEYMRSKMVRPEIFQGNYEILQEQRERLSVMHDLATGGRIELLQQKIDQDKAVNIELAMAYARREKRITRKLQSRAEVFGRPWSSSAPASDVRRRFLLR